MSISSGHEIRGVMTALVTPFLRGEVDWSRVNALVDRQADAGVDWLVPCGTTGESPTLTESEHDRMIEAIVARAAERCSVMAGTGTNDTAEAVRRTKRAASTGVQAALVVVPYYNRPTQEGLFRHFANIAESVDLPIVLYNVPARTGVSLNNDTVVRLNTECPNIVAIKHATGSVDGITDLRARTHLAILCGDDALTWPMMALGAVGVVSVLSNLDPQLLVLLDRAARGQATSAALSHHEKVHELAVRLGRYGPNPVPIKAAMALVGLLEEEYRLPLCPMDGADRAGVEGVLRQFGYLNGEPKPITKSSRGLLPAKRSAIEVLKQPETSPKKRQVGRPRDS